MASIICGNVIQEKSTYEWSIAKFSKQYKTFGEAIWSPRFSSGTNNEFSWQFELFPYGDKEKSDGYLSLYLYSRNYFAVKVSYKFVIKNCINLGITNIHESTFTPPTGAYGYDTYAERSKVLDNIKHLNDVLTLACDFQNVIIIKNCNDSRIGNSKFEVLSDIKQLFINKDFSDVTIKANAKEFKAHKVILSARSKVFAAMFNYDMIENVKNVVEIEDVDCEVLEVMLKFIYTGEVENLEKITKDLLAAADKYAIDGLKNICITKLEHTMNVDNAIELLLFADHYNLDKFKNSIMDFIITNAKDVVTKSEFNLLEDVPSRMVMNLFSKLALNSEK